MGRCNLFLSWNTSFDEVNCPTKICITFTEKYSIVLWCQHQWGWILGHFQSKQLYCLKSSLNTTHPEQFIIQGKNYKYRFPGNSFLAMYVLSLLTAHFLILALWANQHLQHLQDCKDRPRIGMIARIARIARLDPAAESGINQSFSQSLLLIKNFMGV